MNEMDFTLLQALDETKNITKAAEQLFITQSALSKRIRNLEEELGKELMIRTHGGIQFTPAGEKVLMYSRNAASQMREMREELESIGGQICGTLRAGISINYSMYTLPALLETYHRNYPKVSLQLHTGHSRDLFRRLSEGSIDVAILRGEFPWDGTKTLLSSENLCFISRRKYDKQELSSHLFIERTTDLTQFAMISRWLRENNVVMSGSNIRMDSITACVELVKRDIGWSIIPEIGLRDFNGCIEPCRFADGEPLVRKTYLFCRHENAALPQVQKFIDEAKKVRDEA